MGLDWKVRKRGVVDMSEKVGSYSSWQQTRGALFKAAKKYAQEQKLESLQAELSKWEPERFYDLPMNYRYMQNHPPKPEQDHYEFLHGLHQFLCHSDCDGQHSWRVSAQILHAYETVASYFEDAEEKDFWNRLLVPFLNASVEHKTPIIYG